MWVTVLIVCFCHAAYSTAQDITSYNSEYSDNNQEVNWSNKPVTLVIRNGQSDKINSTEEFYGGDQTLFYSNQWRPILMPIEYNQNEELTRYQPETGYSVNSQFIPTFLHRPDSELNATASINPQATNNEKETVFQKPLPLDPIVYYPHPFNFYTQDYTQPSNSQILQNSSTLVSGEKAVSDSDPSRSEEIPGEIVPKENFSLTPYESRRLNPLEFYGNMQGFIPSRIPPPYVPPYSFLPFSRTDLFNPTTNPSFDDQTNLGIRQNLPPVRDVPAAEKQTTPDYIPENESITKEDIQKESSSNIVPPPPLPLQFPVAGYPFGVVPPPPFVPSFIPNARLSRGRSVPSNLPLSRDPFFSNFRPAGLPITPLITPFSNVPLEAPGAEEVLPPPAIEAIPSSEQPVPVLPAVDGVPPELDVVPTNIKVDDESVLENESPVAAKIPYEYGYDMNDGQGTYQHRKEVSDSTGRVTGSYGFRDLYGTYRLVNYIADQNGFQAFIKSNEPGIASSGSANVVVMAEPPQPHAVAEAIKSTEPEAIAVAPEIQDLIAAASATNSD